MTHHRLAWAVLAALLALASTGQAIYDENQTACPEGYACIMDAPADGGNETAAPPDDGAGNGTGACDADKCVDAIDDPNATDCERDLSCTSGSAPDEGAGTGTCMDGQQGNEVCDPEVYYLGGGAGGKGNATGSPVPPKDADAKEQGAPKAVPGPGGLLVLGALGAGALGLAFRRR